MFTINVNTEVHTKNIVQIKKLAKTTVDCCRVRTCAGMPNGYLRYDSNPSP